MQILILSLGPVQEFIESARKCRDLWFGSWLLSELSRAAARGVVETEGAPEPDVLIFPGTDLREHDRAVANKIVARVKGDPASLAARAEASMRTRLRQIRDTAFKQVARGHPARATLFLQQNAEEQVDGLIEFLWASAPEPDGDRGYSKALSEAERILAAVKNSKRWSQPAWAKDGTPKSSLDGVRESVLHESLYDNPKDGSAARNMAEGKLRREFGVHGSERLCGVGLLKRFGATQGTTDHLERIFSTSHVASGPFRAGLGKQPEPCAAWDILLRELGDIEGLVDRLDVVPREDPTTGKVDGSVMYEGRLTETLEELGYRADRDKATFDKVRRSLRAFLGRVKAKLGEPIPYYAILLADGDRMGKAISEIHDFREHQKLSNELEKFASSTRTIVQNKYDGALIYAGGDDVMALLPLHTVLDCAKQLADDFYAAMKHRKVIEQGVEGSPTLSVGIVIVHHLMPLDEALALVRQTEKIAKAVPGKNALAIQVKKRGGEPTVVSGSWGQIDKRLREQIDLHLNNAVPTKAQYELMDLATRTENAGPLEPIMKQVREVEARRILARKQTRGQKDLARETHERLARMDAFSDPARLGRELYVAHLLAQAHEQANPPPPKEAPTSQEVSS